MKKIPARKTPRKQAAKQPPKRGRGRPRLADEATDRLQIVLTDSTLARLDAARARTGESRSAIARRLIETGLKQGVKGVKE